MSEKTEKVTREAASGFFFSLLVAAGILTAALFSAHARAFPHGDVPFNGSLSPWALLLFPTGLAGFGPNHESSVFCLSLIGYALYAVFGGLFAFVRTRPAFYVLVAFYAAYLLFNVTGCQRMLTRPPTPGHCFNDTVLPSMDVARDRLL